MDETIRLLFYNIIEQRDAFSSISPLYVFTTENIRGYMEELSGKTVLTVASSGDHYLNALAMGAKQVDVFDINFLTKFIISLKCILMEQMDLESFLSFFGIIDSKDCFSYEIYQQYAPLLEEDVKAFWDQIYDYAHYKGPAILHSGLFIGFHQIEEKSVFVEANAYLQKENYVYLQKRLQERDKSISIIHADIQQLASRLSSSYDCIYCSNINEYVCKQRYQEAISSLYPHLYSHGKLFYAYVYDFENNEGKIRYEEDLKNPHISSLEMDNKSGQRDKVFIYTR